jgi:fructose-bisphosphate aldolase class II
MKTLREALTQAESSGVAIGHFNISDYVALKAIFEAARDLGVPVVIGVSEGERQFLGVRQVAAMIRSLREEYNFPVFLNADHTHSLGAALEVAKAGFDWIVFDASALPFEENIRQTREAVAALKAIRPSILVEGEIGDIGSGSEIHILGGSPNLTTPAQAVQFVAETHVDTLAPAVGNRHGMTEAMAAGETRKHLDIERIRAIKDATHIFMTLHGGSGTDDGDLRQAIAAGMTVVHISTELRVAWRRGFDSALANQPQEIVPYKILPHVVETIREVVSGRLALFNSIPSRARSAS